MLTIHKASAGSGKTYALTYHYIKLLLGHKQPSGRYMLAREGRNRHRAILAITFTNKATEEMKQRIVLRLTELASPDPRSCPYAESLCRELSTDISSLSARAAQALADLLADFTFFNVSTIDSFFQTVLRTFAREANLTGAYQVELDEAGAIAMGVSEMLASINNVSPSDTPLQTRRRRILEQWLEHYMTHQINQGKAFNLFVRHSSVTGSLTKFIGLAMNETYRLNADRLKRYFDDPDRILRFTSALHKANRTLQDEARTAIASTRALIEEAPSAYFKKSFLTAISYIEKYLDTDLSKSGRASDLIKSIRTALEPEGRYVAKGMKEMALTAADEAIAVAYRTAASAVLRRHVYNSVLGDIYFMGLIAETERQTDTLQRDNNSIVLASTNSILRSIINQEEAPFIYERLGMRLRHFLIDEFQDTSRMQWLNLSPLVHESLASDNDNLIIGDQKQAIYRFRNSDPELIATQVPAEFPTQSRQCGTSVDENTNWRSSREIVQFNNTLYTAVASSLGLDRSVYAGVAQRVRHADKPGYVLAEGYDDEADALDAMIRQIERQLDAGYSQRDIAILVNTHTDGAKAVAALLEHARTSQRLSHLRVVTQDSLTVADSPVVKRIVAVLRFIDSIHVDLADSTTVTQRIAAITNRFEYYLASGSCTAAEAMGRAMADERAGDADGDMPQAERMAIDAASMECVNLPSIVERIIARYVVSEAEAESENIYISAFQDLVADFSSRSINAPGGTGIHAFLTWWDEKGRRKRINIPSDIDAIQVMTIHKSKGLEFPCVHLPLVNWSLCALKGVRWFFLRDTAPDASADEGPVDADEFADPSVFDPADVPPMLPLSVSASLASCMERQMRMQYDDYLAQETTDALNKTYVATTRAVREMIIGFKKPPRTSKSLGSGAALDSAFSVATAAFCATNTADKGLDPDMLAPLAESYADFRLEFGSPTAAPSDRGDEEAAPDATPMPPYRSFDNDTIWNTSRIEDLEAMQRPRQQGIALHEVMGHVRHRSDLPGAIRRGVMRGYIDADEAPAMEQALAEALYCGEALVEGWFEGYTRLLTERTVSVKAKSDASGRDRYRPDRVVWTAQGTIDVIDFKFGVDPDAEPAYRRQVSRYMRLIRQATGSTAVRGFIWYPLQRHIVTVD